MLVSVLNSRISTCGQHGIRVAHPSLSAIGDCSVLHASWLDDHHTLSLNPEFALNGRHNPLLVQCKVHCDPEQTCHTECHMKSAQNADTVFTGWDYPVERAEHIG